MGMRGSFGDMGAEVTAGGGKGVATGRNDRFLKERRWGWHLPEKPASWRRGFPSARRGRFHVLSARQRRSIYTVLAVYGGFLIHIQCVSLPQSEWSPSQRYTLPTLTPPLPPHTPTINPSTPSSTQPCGVSSHKHRPSSIYNAHTRGGGSGDGTRQRSKLARGEKGMSLPVSDLGIGAFA